MTDYLLIQLTDSYNAGVLVLLVFIGGFVGLMETSGGAAAFAKRVAHIISNRTRAQLAAWFGGVAIFFSDLGTPLIVGPIFEPLMDKLKLSREKLAWILDSTASPVAVLVPVTGWAVYIMGLIQKEYAGLGITESDWTAFVRTIPFNVFSILTVLMVPLVALTGYEFGAMAKAERRTRETGDIYWPGSKPLRPSSSSLSAASSPILVWLPLVVLFGSLVGILAPLGFPFRQVPGGAFRAALSAAYLFAAITLMFLMRRYRVKSFDETIDTYTTGMQKMMTVAAILVLAWALGTVGEHLGTANYTIELIRENVPGWLIPPLVFLVGAVMSFATGSSWGSFAIMLPIVIPMAHALGAPIHASIGAVLSGGLFGDHASPISDTTILSSMGAACDHIDHVKTQLPYALLNAGISLVVFAVAGVTASPAVLVMAVVLLPILYFALARIRGAKGDRQ
jgi:Na+/H+ antiporter NhaC